MFTKMFAVSSVLKMNDYSFIVTLPIASSDHTFSNSLEKYHQFLLDRHLTQTVYPMEIPRTGSIEFSQQPLPLRYSEDPRTEV